MVAAIHHPLQGIDQGSWESASKPRRVQVNRRASTRAAVAALCLACLSVVAAAPAKATESGSSGGVDPGSEGGQAPPPPPPPPTNGKRKSVFPVRGSHSYGDRFGAPRDGYSHQGQDIVAACKTPLVSVRKGVVKVVDYHSRAGWYVVIDNAGTGKDFAYMHLKKKVAVKRGQRVKAGRRIGMVGKTGDATGCHLHFEIWQGGWRTRGSKPVDPLPKLKRWDR